MKCSPWAARTRPLPSVDVGLEALNVAEVDGLAQRCEWVAGGHELVRHIPMVISSGDAPHDAIPLHFLGAIQLVPMRNSTGVEVAEPVNIFLDGADQVPFHDLHVVDVVQQIPARFPEKVMTLGTPALAASGMFLRKASSILA